MSFYGLASLGLFIAAILLWMTELIPLAVTALLIPVGASWFGLLPAQSAFHQFGNQILFLFLGTFLLAIALEKHHLDKRMAYWLLSKKFASKSPSTIIFFIALFTWLVSMWISNTAATAMMIPLCLGISKSLSVTWIDEDKRNLEKRLLFASAFAASIGGMATPVGSPPNLLAIELLEQSGVTISFLHWMKLGVPLSFLLLLGLLALLHWKYPIKAIHAEGIHEYFLKHYRELGKIKKTESIIVGTFLFTVLLWILPDLFLLLKLDIQLSPRIPAGAAGIIGAVMLFILPHEKNQKILEWKDASGVDWGTILIFGGGLCLGKIMESSGLASELSHLLFSIELAPWQVGLLCAVLGILISEFSSNTAATTLLIPIIVAQFSGSDRLIAYTVAATFGASFGFMLPVSTPPNALIFGTGKIALKEMMKTGIWLDIIGATLIVLSLFFLYPLFDFV